MLKNIIYLIILTFLSGETNFIDFEVITNNSPYPEKLLIHTFGGSKKYMSILDHNLDPYWQINSNDKGMDFKKNSEDITYFRKIEVSDPNEPTPGLPSTGPEWIVMNSMMQEIDTIKCTSGITDYHDIQLLTNGNYILQAYDSLYINMQDIIEGGHPSAMVQGILRIQEFDQEHNLLMDWFALDHLDISEYDNLNFQSQQITFMHGNSIDVDYDENIIISNRRSSEVIKIDRLTGEVIWIIGGPQNEFEIFGDNLNGFSKQHDVRRLENGNILLFDNGNNHNPATSRAVEYEIDEINKTLTLIWEYLNPYGEVSLAMGSAQRLPNGNTLINWGNIAGASGGRIIEVTYNYEIALEIQFESQMAYKVRKDEWAFEIPMGTGDINLDGVLNILDILMVVNVVLNGNSDFNMLNLYKIDLNRDYSFDVLDIVELVNRVLS